MQESEDFDWLGVSFQPEKLVKLKGDLNLLLARLETSPETLRDLSAYTLSGNVFMSEGGKPKWKFFQCALFGDILIFAKPSDPDPALSNSSRYQCEMCYASISRTEREDDLTQMQKELGIAPTHKRIKIITYGQVIIVAFNTDTDASTWWTLIQRMLKVKFTRDELVQKEEARLAMDPLLEEQDRLIWARHSAIVKALASTGFFIGKERKYHEGYLEDRPRDKKRMAKKYYVVLYRDFLYFFKPHDRVSVDEKPSEFVALQFITELGFDSNRPHRFHITTPLRRIVLQVKHYMAAMLWLTAISDRLETLKVEAVRSFDKRRAKFNTKGYVYTKPIDDRMRVRVKFEGKEEKIKLRKQEVNAIGRSASCEIRCKEDRHLSRQHCKIIVENNVPFAIDLGQSKDGTLLNGVRIKMSALKPGDVISAGSTQIHFTVKRPTIFHQALIVEDSKKTVAVLDDD